MFVPYNLKNHKKFCQFNHLKPTHVFFKWYLYSIKTINVSSTLLIPKIYKKRLVKLL